MKAVSEVDGLQLIESRITPAVVRLRFVIASRSPYFDGHFPGEPLLPGVAQLGLALRAARLLGDARLALVGLRGLRWRYPIRPEREFEVSVTRPTAMDAFRFEIRVAEGVATAGTLLMTPALEPSDA